MSWSELERLVEEAEADASLRRALGHCRSVAELLLACGRLGYRIERQDLRLARRVHRGETGARATGAEPGGPGCRG